MRHVLIEQTIRVTLTPDRGRRQLGADQLSAAAADNSAHQCECGTVVVAAAAATVVVITVCSS